MKARHAERLLLAALAMAVVVLFETDPALDLWFSALFYSPLVGFAADSNPLVRAVYVAVPWLGRGMFVGALLVLAWSAWQRVQVPRRWWRRAAALALCLLLSVGVVTHAVLKDHWGRPRPDETQAFAGRLPFSPALQPTSLCERNCSFVSGHAATGFALAAFGLFAAPARRRRWLLLALVTGGFIGLLRVAQGRHFASDVLFSLISVWASCLICRELWLRVMAARLGRLRHTQRVGRDDQTHSLPQ